MINKKDIHTLDLRQVNSKNLNIHSEMLSSLSAYKVRKDEKKDFEEYKEISKSSNPIVRFFKKIGHIVWWGLRLILPSFLVGHPSLFDNLRTLWKNPQFKPLRMMATAWLIFSVIVGSTGIYNLLKASAAPGDPSIQTGYYLGTGATLSVTGLGFQPQVVIIKSDTIIGATVWKSSAMPAGEYAYLGAASNNTENQITLDSDGFTVQVAADVNTANVRYTYIAFAGSNCTAAGSMCVGTYTGNSAGTQEIQTGFQPDLVWSKRASAVAGNFRTSAMSVNNAASFAALVDDATGLYTTLNPTSFIVGGTNNTNGGIYYYVAFKSLAGFLSVGSYAGDGVAGKTISGLGFKPNFVLTKPNTAIVPAYNITQSWGDYSSFTTALANAAGSIQKLQSGGFIVGTSTSANAVAIPYQYFAFGGAVTPTATESFTMRRGSYTGNGAVRSISGIGFAPDLVIIKSANADHSVWSTSLDNNQTGYLAGAISPFAGGITSMNSDGFSLGTNSTVNTNATVYEYVAFGNATSPVKGVHASDFIIGTYTGNGIDNRMIDNLGIAPDMTVVKSNAANLAVWQSSNMATNTAAFFSATVDDTTGVNLKTLTSDGFTIGTNAQVNTVGAVYRFFAFKKGTGSFNVGNYTGNAASRNITGLGFQPDLVWDKVTTAVRAIHRSSSPTITGTNSQVFLNAVNVATNGITGFVPDGFSVGTAAEVNTNALSYRWVAWQAPIPTSASTTPTNTTPTNAATSIDLNPTLVGSVYSDPDLNPHTDTQWELDDNSDFSSPEWTRSGVATAEETIVVNTTNGTFANNLLGKTELTHGTTYYFRVRYSNGLWSGWSAGTNFTTNIINTPTNTTPADGATVQTYTPSLLASAFSDQQGSHTGVSSQWQIDKTSGFTNPYDSGEVSYSNSFAVPSAVLSNQTTYYFRVRYKDSGGQWSQYSAPTRFLVAQSPITVKPLFSNTVVDQGDSINIDVQVKLVDESVINDATAVISIYNPAGTKIVNAAPMTYVTGSNGVYRYSYTVPSTNGSYLYEATATKNSNSGYGAGNFQVKTVAADINNINSTVSTINSTVSTISSNITALMASMGTLISEIGTGNISAIKTKTDTIDWSNISSIITTTGAIKTKTDTIAWADIGAIKTKTDTISWADVTGIKLETDTIEWGDITTIKSNVATLISEIGTGNISAIKTKTDMINWADITGIQTTADEIKDVTDTIDWNDVAAIKTKTDTIAWSDVTGIKVKTDTINWADVTDTKNAVAALNGSLDMLVGALIVTQSSINDSTPTSTVFITNLINTTDNFYKNAVLTFTSGTLKGQSRRISAYTGSTKAVRLDPALTSIPANGDQFTIIAQNVRTEELANDIALTTTDTNTKVTDIQSKVNAINATLQTVDTKLDTIQSDINALRTSQQSAYTLNFTGAATVEGGKTYRAKLEILDYETKPADSTTLPSITVYDSARNAVVTDAPMTKKSTGEYEYTYNVASGAVAGVWESVVTTSLGTNTQTRTHYWNVTGSPAQVRIVSMQNLTVPDISANVLITNEGGAAYEYQYKWCVVIDQSDSCESPSVIASASAAKLIQPGEDFNAVLALVVPTPGNYWFKLIVTYSGQTSAASRSFTAVSATTSPTNPSNGGSSSSGSYSLGPANLDTIRNQLEVNAVSINKLLNIVGNVDPYASGFKSLLAINREDTASIKDIQNKLADLKAISTTLHQIADQKTTEPIVQTYMKFNSVELHFLITNPDASPRTLHFKAYLPEEVTPKDIMNSDGLKVDYDAQAKTYAVSGDVTLQGSESLVKKVEMNDIWIFEDETLEGMLAQADEITEQLLKTQFGAQASLLESDLKSKVSGIKTSQAASYDAPENHIIVYRQNKVHFDQAAEDITKLKDLLVQSGAAQGLLGKIGGIQAFASWGIILAMVFGFVLMAAIIFAMWRNQMKLTSLALRVHKQEEEPLHHSKRTI